ncbi:MAG TPA: SGNH/GDSL hydrolase family protein [Pyrinomonadaceae bacterium]
MLREPYGHRKKLLFYSIYFTVASLLVLAVAEITARLIGYRPWSVAQARIVVEPGGKFFMKHSTLGYTHLPGLFKVTLSEVYTFKATNLENTLRATHPRNVAKVEGEKQEIWLFGDSITYGWSVNDEETYAWLLQEKLPDYEVVNFGVSGYGTLHSLIQLREAIQSGRRPRLAVIVYASFHDVRNTFIRIRRKMLATSTHLGPLNQPYATLGKDGKLQLWMDTLEFREFPLMRHSALVHALEEAYDRYEERHSRSHEVTKAIIKEFSDLCEANRIELVVAALTSDPTTKDMLDYCRSEGIKTTNMWVDYLNIKENNNLPFDSHPSALAHRQYEQKLESFLLQDVLNNSFRN